MTDTQIGRNTQDKIKAFFKEEESNYQYQMENYNPSRAVAGTFMHNTINVAGRALGLAGYVRIEKQFNLKESQKQKADIVDIIFTTQVKGLIITPGEHYEAQGFYIWSNITPHNSFKTHTAAAKALKTRLHTRASK